MLVAGLPRESALARALRPDLAAWSQTDELLALVAELIDHGNRLYFSAHTTARDTQPEPLRVRRPAKGELAAMAAAQPAPDAVPRMATSEEMAEFFGMTVRYFPDPG